MMGKRIPMSALISGLLAAPALGAGGTAAAAAAMGVAAAAPLVERAQPGFPLQMPADFRRRFRDVLEGRPLDAHGMQSLERRMAGEIQSFIASRSTGIRGTGVSPVISDRSTSLPPASSEPLFPIQQLIPNVPQQGATVGLHSMRLEKGTFLGVTTSPVNPALREALKLPRGMGLVVDYVERGSPADIGIAPAGQPAAPATAANTAELQKDGLRLHDILQKLDDQWLVNPQQLAVLVRAKKPGDTVTLSVVRDGKAIPITVKLGEKELPLLEDRLSAAPGAGTALAGGALVSDGGGGGAGAVQNRTERFSISTNADGSSSRQLADGEHDIAITTTKDGQQTLTLKTRAGEILFNGPAADARLPEDILRKVRTLAQRSDTTRIQITGNSGGISVTGSNQYSLSRSDKDHEITVRRDGENWLLTVKDLKTGQSYDGPADSPDDITNAPAAAQQKVKALLERARGK